jgi:DNA-binding MarR family transcriptional regulator
MAVTGARKQAQAALDVAAAARRFFPRGGYEGLDAPSLQVLLALLVASGQSVTSLQQLLLVTQSQVSKSVTRLLDDGLIVQEYDAHDARVRRHSLTRCGEQLVERYLRSVA